MGRKALTCVQLPAIQVGKGEKGGRSGGRKALTCVQLPDVHVGKGEKGGMKGGEKIAELCPAAGQPGEERREGRKEGQEGERR